MKTHVLNLIKVTLLSLFILQIISCGNRERLKENIILKNNTEITATKEKDLVESKEQSDYIITESIEPIEKPILQGNTEAYDHVVENDFMKTLEQPLSTFSIDVDNASYSNLKRFAEHGQKPPKGAVRIEEMINYFTYDYQNPDSDQPFSIQTEISQAPWNNKNQLLKIGIQGKKINYDDLKPSNLVFLIDVSGSMSDQIELLKKSFKLMVKELPKNSTVAIVTYAGNDKIVLKPTNINETKSILNALEKLSSGGGTAGAKGIETAYQLADKSFIKNGNNRIVLATDGDFNIGASSNSEMVDMIVKKSKQGVFLTVCGFGMGNYNDSMMEQISNYGNGNYFYINNYKEAVKVFKTELIANLFTIAKDVKIQVEFNPNTVMSYRLIGYENRKLNNQDFDNDAIDAGELGAGHTVTALYEIVPNSTLKITSKLKYQNIKVLDNKTDLVTLKLRYKPIKSDTSKLIKLVVSKSDVKQFSNSTKDFKFATSVAALGMLLTDSKHKNDLSYETVLDLAKQGKGNDKNGYRAEFISLVQQFDAIKN